MTPTSFCRRATTTTSGSLPENLRDDRDPARGRRALVVDTGGIGHYAFTGSAANVEASDGATHGALKLVLDPNGMTGSSSRRLTARSRMPG
jgi:hypothetical protein